MLLSNLPQKVTSQHSCDTIWLFSLKHLCQTKWRVDTLSLCDFILNISFLPVQLLLPLCLCIMPVELLYVFWGHICIYICVWCGYNAPLITLASGLMALRIWSQSSITEFWVWLHLNFQLLKRYPIAIQSQSQSITINFFFVILMLVVVLVVKCTLISVYIFSFTIVYRVQKTTA